MRAQGFHTVVADTATDYLRELIAGDLFVIRGAFIHLGTKSVRYRQEMWHADTGDLHARQEGVEVFFDPDTRAARALPDAVRATIAPHVVGGRRGKTIDIAPAAFTVTVGRNARWNSP